MIWWVWSAIALVAVGGFAYWRSGARTRRREQRKIRRAITTCLTDDVAALEADLHQLEYDLGGRYHYPEVRPPTTGWSRRSPRRDGRSRSSATWKAPTRSPRLWPRAGTRWPAFGPASRTSRSRSDGCLASSTRSTDRRRRMCCGRPTATGRSRSRHALPTQPVSRQARSRTAARSGPAGERCRTGTRHRRRSLWYSTGYFGGDWPASPADVALAVNYCLIGPVPRMSADGTIVHPLLFEDEDTEIDGGDG